MSSSRAGRSRGLSRGEQLDRPEQLRGPMSCSQLYRAGHITQDFAFWAAPAAAAVPEPDQR